MLALLFAAGASDPAVAVAVAVPTFPVCLPVPVSQSQSLIQNFRGAYLCAIGQARMLKTLQTELYCDPANPHAILLHLCLISNDCGLVLSADRYAHNQNPPHQNRFWMCDDRLTIFSQGWNSEPRRGMNHDKNLPSPVPSHGLRLIPNTIILKRSPAYTCDYPPTQRIKPQPSS